MTDKTHDQWPFDFWLKMAVERFHLSPKEFWATSVRDWFVLMRSSKLKPLSPERLTDLMQAFPDKEPHPNPARPDDLLNDDLLNDGP